MSISPGDPPHAAAPRLGLGDRLSRSAVHVQRSSRSWTSCGFGVYTTGLYCEDLKYVRLPQGLVDRVDKKLDQIKVHERLEPRQGPSI